MEQSHRMSKMVYFRLDGYLITSFYILGKEKVYIYCMYICIYPKDPGMS